MYEGRTAISGSYMRAPLGQRGRIPSLDGLRAVAITLVLAGHSIGTQHFFCLRWKAPIGEFGVRIFFVLSGFLISSLLLKELELSGRISLKNFYLRRVFRIFPASYTYMLIVAILAALGLLALHAHDLLRAITYTSNYYGGRGWYVGHLWSLSVEEQFYLLWPLTLCLVGRKRGIVIAAIVCVLVPLMRVGEFVFVPALRVGVDTRFETVADSMAIGCVLAGTRDWLSRCRPYMRILSSVLFAFVPILTLAMCLFPLRLRFELTVGYSLMNLGIALCLDWCIRFDGHPIGRALNWRPVTFVGVLSYSLYLWQQPFVDRYSRSPLAAFPLDVALAFCAALGSYYFVERPFLRLKRRFESPATKSAVANAVPSGDPLQRNTNLGVPVEQYGNPGGSRAVG